MNRKNCNNTGFKWVGDDKEGVIKVCECDTTDGSPLHPLSIMVLEHLEGKVNLAADTFNVDYRSNLLIDKDELEKQLEQTKQEVALVTNGVVKINFKTLREKNQLEYCGYQCDDGLIIKNSNDGFFITVCRCNKLEHRDLHPLTKQILREFSGRVFTDIAVEFETHLIISNKELSKQARQVIQELRELFNDINVIFDITNISQRETLILHLGHDDLLK